MLCYIAKRFQKLASKGKSPYKAIYSTVPIKGCHVLKWPDLGDKFIPNSLILVDEMTLEQDSRDWKSFDPEIKRFITLHRHANSDLIFTVQDWSRCEKTVRQNCQELFYISKFSKRWVRCTRIYRCFDINEYMSEMILGYRFSQKLSEKLKDFIGFYNISKVWDMYDTHDKMGLDKRPLIKSPLWYTLEADSYLSGARRTPARKKSLVDEKKFDLVVENKK